MNKPLSYISLSKEAFRHNVQFFRNQLPKTTKLVAVIKANAYGHGLKETVQALENLVDFFQVDDIEEFVKLRKYSQKTTLIYGYIEPKNTAQLINENGIPAIFSPLQLVNFNREATALNITLPIHLAIDANFGREGIIPSQIDEILKLLESCKNVAITGAYAHFANADCDPSGTVTAKQLSIFNELIFKLPKNIFTSIAATAGTIISNEAKNLSAVRIGIGLYGSLPNDSKSSALISPMTWKSTVVEIKRVPANSPIGYGGTYITNKPTTLALIPQGYSDGINRLLSNKGAVLIAGTRCPIRGRVSMNMIVVDVTHLSDPKVGEEVIIIGKQGEENITAAEIANLIGTIDYEVFTSVSPLLPRELSK